MAVKKFNTEGLMNQTKRQYYKNELKETFQITKKTNNISSVERDKNSIRKI